MGRKFGLNEHFPSAGATSCPTGYLDQRLREPLGRAEIGTEQALIGVQHDDEGHVGKIMPFGDHLCADEDACLTGGHALHRRLHVAALSDDISVEPHERSVREHLLQGLFDALGPLTDRFHGKSALRAAGRHGLIGSAVMTPKPIRRQMHGHSSVAILAGRNPTARGAKQSGRISAAIEEYQDLAVVAKVSLHCLDGGR